MELHSRKGGKSGSIGYVLDEVERLDGACPHVTAPAPPEQVWGISVQELRSLHDNRVEHGRVSLENGRQRRIRNDQNTLFSVVLSFPEELALADPYAVREWEKRSVKWLRQEFGEDLKTVVRHVDEKHPHLHAYGLDKGSEMRAAALHPGFKAKAAALAAGEDNQAGDRAYREAMRQWQDRYWNEVGLACGLARLGPGKRRLSRAEWHQEKIAYRAVRTARKAAAAIDARAQNTHRTAQKALLDAQERLGRVTGLGKQVVALWRTVGGLWTDQEKQIEEKLRDEVSSVRSELAADVTSANNALREERQKSRNLRDTIAAMGEELEAARRELGQLRPKSGYRPKTPKP